MWGLTTITAPATEPVSLALAKAHLRIDHDAEDTLIESWIKAARQLTESYTNKRWITQELRLTLAAWPDGGEAIRLPVEPIASIDLVQYRDVSGDLTELDSSLYQTWLDHSPPLLAPAVDEVWPDLQSGAMQAVTVEFTAGTAANLVPEQVKTAILLAIGDWDKNRAGEGDPIGRGLPSAAKFLLDQLWTGSYQ